MLALLISTTTTAAAAAVATTTTNTTTTAFVTLNQKWKYIYIVYCSSASCCKNNKLKCYASTTTNRDYNGSRRQRVLSETALS